MKRRKPLLREFVKDYDLVLFISGRNSSNGNMLYSYAKSFNGNIFLIEHKNEIQSSWLKGAKSIGISGATSTPAWQLTEVKEHLLSITAG
jgi:4-hydroxy-3-methylbut-2-enyl diphosphate reductase